MNDQYDGYHLMDNNEVSNFHDRISDIKNAYRFIKENFINHIRQYLYICDNEIKTLEVEFQNKNFMHLCGVKYGNPDDRYNNGAKKFVQAIKKDKINVSKVWVKDDGSTFQKLNVIKYITEFNGLDIKVGEDARLLCLEFHKILRTRKTILGIGIDVDDKGISYPKTLLNLQQSTLRTREVFNVYAILDIHKETHNKSVIVLDDKCSKKVRKYIAKFIQNN